MYIMYIDESGDTTPISQKGKKFLVLTGCIIHENEKIGIEEKLRKIKYNYYQNPDIEIKSNFLRYANPDLSEFSPIKNMLRWSDSGFWKKCPNIVEKVLFAASDKTIGIQISDLYCYPIFHIFEYNKAKDEYWRFKNVTLPKICKVGSRIDGIGLKFFPETSKKDLRYFE